jgi:hypothetical protein
MQSMIASAQFTENFSDGAFTGADRSVNWSGDVDSFMVNSDKQLQLNTSKKEVIKAQLRTPSSLVSNGEWTFSVKMGFNPSADNYVRMYLVSDEADLTGELNGYFVRIGGDSKDFISLHQATKGKTNATVIKGAEKRFGELKAVDVTIRVTWDHVGNVSLYSQLAGESDFTLEGTKVIADVPASQWFGLVCYGSKTNGTNFAFDDFVVQTLDPNVSAGIDPLDNANALRIEYPTPDNNQYGIHYQLDRAGYNVRLFVYDLMGRKVESWLNNEVLGSSGVIYHNFGSNLRSGLYIVYLEAFDALGNVQQLKKPVVVK